jgi:hypothetical protein
MGHQDHLTKLHISHALGTRATRVAVLIVESIQLGFELLDEEPTAVIEAVRDYVRGSIPRAPSRARRELREAFVKYAQEALRKAERRRLLHAITGSEYDEGSEEGPEPAA